MMKRYESSIELLVGFLNDFGFDYSVSRKIKKELDIL